MTFKQVVLSQAERGDAGVRWSGGMRNTTRSRTHAHSCPHIHTQSNAHTPFEIYYIDEYSSDQFIKLSAFYEILNSKVHSRILGA